MKVTVINGNARHGSTWHCMDQLLQELSRYGKVETTQFFLPKDMPHFCRGCFSCFYNGEHTCPHADSVTPLIDAMVAADVVVLTSPVYALDVSGQLKAFLDHLCFMWLSHRPNPRMFNKVGVTITTTAGMGLRSATKTMRDSLRFLGVKRLFSLKHAVAAMKWNDVSEKSKHAVSKKNAAVAKKIAKAALGIDRLASPLFRTFLFKLMAGMMKKNTWNLRDRKHWEDHGWI